MFDQFVGESIGVNGVRPFLFELWATVLHYKIIPDDGFDGLIATNIGKAHILPVPIKYFIQGL